LPERGGAMSAEHIHFTPGSSGSLFAAAIARLGLPSAITARVGDDWVGRFLLERLSAAGVELKYVRVEKGTMTGICVCLATGDERTMISNVPTSALTGPEDLEPVDLREFDYLHVSSYFLLKPLQQVLPAFLERARHSGLVISVDPGWDRTGRWDSGFLELLRYADFLFLNEAEAGRVAGVASAVDAIEILAGYCPRVVVKRGARGVIAKIDGEVFEFPAYPVDSLDATGAGDAFDAGFLYAWSGGGGPGECLRFASACGAIIVSSLGGFDGQPDAARVNSFLDGVGGG